VFVRDVQTGKTVRVSVASDGRQGDGPSDGPSLSADGRYVAFNSSASNLVAGDTNRHLDVFVRDLTTGTTIRADVQGGGKQARVGGDYPQRSANGRFVAFESGSPNLVAGDTNGTVDVFVRRLLPASP
jgi:Tol biopolymer transport system component